MANGKISREPVSVSLDSDLLTLLREYCSRHDRNLSDAVNLSIKTLLAIERAKDPLFWVAEYAKLDE